MKLKNRIKKTLEDIVSKKKKKGKEVIASSLIFSQLFFYSILPCRRAYADDVTASNNVTLVTSSDTDGDGLTDIREQTTDMDLGTPGMQLTDYLDADTDDDGFSDGTEVGNSKGDPLKSSAPGMGAANTLREFRRIRNITTGTSTHEISPVWLLGGRMGYIESATDFSNGTIFVKNIFDLTEPRQELKTGLSAEIRELGAGRLGTKIFYHEDDGTGKDAIRKVSRLTEIDSKAVPGPLQSLEYGVRNPSIFANLTVNRDTAGFSVDGEMWLIAGTDNPSATGVTANQIRAFQLRTSGLGIGNWDGTDPTQITNFSNRTARPKVNKDGKIMFQEIDGDGKTQIWVYDGLADVLDGTAPAFYGTADSRGEAFAFFDWGVSYPGGFSSLGDFFYWITDQNKVYSLSDPLNFSGSNFDIMGRGSFTSFVMPVPDDQLTIAVSIEGGRLAFADGYLRDSTGDLDIYMTNSKSACGIVDGMKADFLNGFKTPCGVSLEGNYHSDEINSVTSPLSIELMLDPVREATQAASVLTARRRFGPTGLTGRIHMRTRWGVSDLIVQDATGDNRVLDENTFFPVYEDHIGSVSAIPASQIIERNTAERWIDYFVTHFSGVALKAQYLPQPVATGLDNLGFYDPLGVGSSHSKFEDANPTMPEITSPGFVMDDWANER